MEYQTEEDKVLHETALRRQDIIWENYHEHMMLSDRAAVDIGISALKTCILLNAGALVALITFVAQVLAKNELQHLARNIFDISYMFVWGLVLGGAAFVFAYFYQSAVTSSFDPALSEIPLSKKTASNRLTNSIRALAVIMILCAISSLGFFTKGASDILHSFSENGLVNKSVKKVGK